MATRRHILAGLLATTLPRLGWADAGNPAYLAAAQGAGGGFDLHGLNAAGASLFAIPLPARGHAATAHPTRPEAVAFARRPGIYALVIHCVTGQVQARLTPPAGRQFNGHGCFSQDGAVLYTSEVVAETSEGRIGLWDAARGYARMGEWASGGIGPHDLRRLPGRDVLVVANGGIQTDPDDRTKLNIATMRPNLCYLTPEGAVQDQVELAAEYYQNSIRHLALGPDGAVAFALQWEGDPADPVPLLGLHRMGTSARLCPAPEAEAYAMQGYAGSIAFDASGGLIGLTSPKGGVVQIFGAEGAFIATHSRPDACGIAAADAAGFIVTDGGGTVSHLTDSGFAPLCRGAAAWDNHLVPLAT
ncbi:DUF1513 domain-containing protein [Fertoebacter nigrum]|uniref:DUF1513 domain-containing protein n=1 Tax=Fertoeibacter niger TaxID=2656921 RepID=A0A8X8H2A5_9RHOB|nr:DUF1513 domain-containing protein [Fertoeibacter niger]NUB46258.1 DUF1513 domain-containing protein [Fertoeibacter niger]